MNDAITREEAIDRMKAGLPCETAIATEFGVFIPTRWSDFDDGPERKFRKPPEPQRAARERWIQSDKYISNFEADCSVHYREVLPGDVTLQRMTETEARKLAMDQMPVSGWVKPTDMTVAFAKRLGLLKENK